MKKIALLFPGQGAQYVGMAMDILAKFPELKQELQNFDEKNNLELYKIMKEGPEEKLKETRFTQPAILFHSIAALKMLQQEIEIKPAFVAGHSLGEFSALVANGVLKLQDAMYLVHKRGEFMIKASEGSSYAMSAVIGSNPVTIKDICKKVSEHNIVVAANFNTPVQTVISGTQKGVHEVTRILKEQKVKRIIPLKVGGAFHSPLIKKAGEWLASEMDKIKFSETNIPLISNVDAKPTTDINKIKENLRRQVTSSVLWLDSVKFMLEAGVELFIEFGPQKVLAGMLRKIDRKAKIISIDTIESFEAVKEELKAYE